MHHPAPASDNLFVPFNIGDTANFIHEPLPDNSQHPPRPGGTVLDQDQPAISAGISSSLHLDDPWLDVLPDVPEGTESVDQLAMHIPLWPKGLV